MAASWLLDSNIVIAAIKGTHRPLLNRLAGLAPTRLLLSSLVEAELLYGAEKSRHATQARTALGIVTAGMASLAFDPSAASAYARIRTALERKGTSIGPMDMLIAAQAVAHDLVLVTDNLREFRRVPGLRCENWLKS